MRNVLLAFCFVAATASAGWADSGDNGPWERFSFSVAGFASSLDTSVRLGTEQGGVGVEIDLEDTTGLDASETVFRLDALGRLGEERNHRLDFSYFLFDRNATRTVQQDIDFGNLPPISVGDTIHTEFKIEVYKLNYGYSLFKDDRFDLSAGLGLFVMPIEFGIQTASGVSEFEKITAPLPVLSLRMDFAITPRFFLRQGFELMYLEIDDFRGAISNSSIALEYKLHEKIGLGLGFDSFRLGLKAKGEDYPEIDFVGTLKFNYTGALLFAKYYF